MSKPESSQAELREKDSAPLIGDFNGLILTAMTLIGLYLCSLLALPFLPAIVWALMLAVVFAPFQRLLERRIRNITLATAISILVIAVIVVLPAGLVVNRLLLEIRKGADSIHKFAASGDLLKTFENQPFLTPVVRWTERQVDLAETFGSAATWLTNTAASLLRGSVVQFIGIVLTFYLLYYFLRDRHRALVSLRAYLPLSPDEMERLFTRVADTIHATVYGTLTVAAIQGTLGGLMFWFLGLPAPLLWGIIMALLAVVPILGAFVVWIPAALWLASQGHWGKALLLTAWGGIVVAGIDNIIYPILVGNRLKEHTVVAFVSLVGGLIVFGSAGIILGPLVVTITFLLLEIRQGRKPGGNGAPYASRRMN